MKARKALVLCVLFGLVFSMLGVAGCAPAAREERPTEPVTEEPVPGGTFVYHISQPAYIDPINLQEYEGIQVGQVLFDSLVAFDSITSELEPAAAESWSSNEDATVWTFDLVEGATFHNGREVVAGDFKFAWERIANPENGSDIAYHLSAVKGYDAMRAGEATELEGVRVVDDHTLEVTLSYPFADFPYVVGHPALAPVPAEETENPEFGRKPIGNGPFMMSEPWADDQYIRVERYADYHGALPHIDGIEFRILADSDIAWLEFQQGSIDFVQIPTGQIQATVRQFGESQDGYTLNPGTQVALGTQFATYFLLINSEEDVLNNPDVRRAISLAIDREAICTAIFEDTREPATGIVPDWMPGFQENGFEYARHDVAEARRLLDRAGFPGGEGIPTIQLSYNTGEGHEYVLQLVQNNLNEIGIETELVGMEWAEYLDTLDAKDYQIGRIGWSSDYPIMDNFLYPLFMSDSADNLTGWANPEVDSMLEQARRMVDGDARIALYQEIERMIGADSPVVPLMFYSHFHVASDRVMNGIYGPMGLFDFGQVWLRQ